MPSPPCNDQHAVAAATALPRNFVLLDCFSGSIAGPSSRVILRSLRQPACARLPSQQRPQNESQPATRPCRLQAHAGSLPQVIRDSSLRLAVVWALGAIRLLIPAIQALQPAATHVWRARPHPRPRGPRAPLAAIVDPVHLVRHPPHHRHEHLDALEIWPCTECSRNFTRQDTCMEHQWLCSLKPKCRRGGPAPWVDPAVGNEITTIRRRLHATGKLG